MKTRKLLPVEWIALGSILVGSSIGLAGADPAPVSSSELGLPNEAASLLAGALSRSAELSKRQTEPVTEDDVRQLESVYLGVLRSAPEHPAVLTEANGFYRSWGYRLAQVSPGVLDWIEHHPDPAAAALGLTEHLLEDGRGKAVAEMALAALAARPRSGEAALWDRVADATLEYDWPWKIAFRAQAVAASPADAPLAAEWLGELLRAGLTQQAVEAFDTLPEATRSRIENGDPEILRALRGEEGRDDPRLGLCRRLPPVGPARGRRALDQTGGGRRVRSRGVPGRAPGVPPCPGAGRRAAGDLHARPLSALRRDSCRS
jgi:hypothetical protein